MEDGRHAQRSRGRAVEREGAAHSTGCDVRRRRQHHGQYLLHQLAVGGRQKHVLDPLGEGLLIAGLDGCRHCLHDGAPLGRKNKRRVDHDNCRDAAGMRRGQLQDNHAAHAVTDRDDFTEAHLLDDVRNIVGIGRDRVWSRRHRVVSVDLRGHGESDKPPGPYPIAAYADDIAYIIEQVGLSKIVAVGHSMGGVIVLQLAAAHLD